MKSTRLLKTYDERTTLRYLEYKGLAFVSGRDFCNVHHWRRTKNGTILAVAYAEERLDLCPTISGLVRGELVIAGYVIEPIHGEEGEEEAGVGVGNSGAVRTKVTYVVKTDIKGSIPGWIMKIKSKEQPMQLLEMKNMLDEEANAYPGGKKKFIFDKINEFIMEEGEEGAAKGEEGEVGEARGEVVEGTRVPE